jgi:hypothetical protein
MTHPHPRALEAAARAMIEATSGPFEMLDETGKEAARFEARAAVTAYLDALQETHALVPREATEEMVSAFFKARDILRSMDFPRPTLPSYTWRAMIDAAPPAAQDPRP